MSLQTLERIRKGIIREKFKEMITSTMRKFAYIKHLLVSTE